MHGRAHRFAPLASRTKRMLAGSQGTTGFGEVFGSLRHWLRGFAGSPQNGKGFKPLTGKLIFAWSVSNVQRNCLTMLPLRLLGAEALLWRLIC